MTGIGSLQLGGQVSESDLVEFDPDYCALDQGGASSSDPALARWVWRTLPSESPEVHLWAPTGVTQAIEVRTDEIPTDRGLRVGATSAELTALYPELEAGKVGRASSLWIQRDGRYALIFEATAKDYGTPAESDRVVSILAAIDPDPTYFGLRVGSDYLIGGCL